MRCYDNGSELGGFTVSFSERDTENFASSWPASTVKGKGYLCFAECGDIEDSQVKPNPPGGPDWLAFVESCRDYGLKRIEANRKKIASREKRVQKAIDKIMGT